MGLIEFDSLLLLCVVVIAGIGAWMLVVFHQRRVIASAGGLVMALKRGDQRWANEVGRYAGDELVWYRTLSFSPTAAHRLPRQELTVLATRPWDPGRDMALRPNLMIVECRLHGGEVSLGFPDNGLTGFLSWLEAAAPRF